jgi:hypothetical protein
MSVKNKSYQVVAKLELYVSAEIFAVGLEEAVQKAITLKEDNFVEILGDYLDGVCEVTGVYQS